MAAHNDNLEPPTPISAEPQLSSPTFSIRSIRSIRSTSSKRSVAPRGLTDHGLPKTPMFAPSRVGASSPPLSPRSFMSLFRADDSPLSPKSSTFGLSPVLKTEPSPLPTPTIPEVAVPKDEHGHHDCPCCRKAAAAAAATHKETLVVPPAHSTAKPLSRFANRLKTTFTSKKAEEKENKRPSRHSKGSGTQKIGDDLHWSEM